MPGYFNHKRDSAFLIRSAELSDAVNRPSDFPDYREQLRSEALREPTAPQGRADQAGRSRSGTGFTRNGLWHGATIPLKYSGHRGIPPRKVEPDVLRRAHRM